jgi:hypothetical protein
VVGDRADIVLNDPWLGSGRPAHLREPPEVGWTPLGRARITDLVPEPEGLEPERGRLEVPPGIFAGAAALPHGCIFHRGDIDGREIT